MKEYVNLLQAKALKKLGYGIPTKGYYYPSSYNDTIAVNYWEGEVNKISLGTSIPFPDETIVVNHNYLQDYFSAPTLEDARKWLTKYGFSLNILDCGVPTYYELTPDILHSAEEIVCEIYDQNFTLLENNTMTMTVKAEECHDIFTLWLSILKFIDANKLIRKSSVDKIAVIQHEIWRERMKNQMTYCTENSDGSLTIPANIVNIWKRVIGKSYNDLTHKHKKYNRDLALKMKEHIK